MKYFKSRDLSSKEMKKKLIGSVIPRPVALVTSLSEAGVLNLAPFSYFNIVAYRPPILSLAIQRQAGEVKDTSRNILARQEAVVHIVTDSILADANEAAASLAPDQSELDRTQLTPTPSIDIETPGLKEAQVRFECQLYDHIKIFKDQEVTADLILLEVVSTHLDDGVYDSDKDYILADALQAVSRLAGDDYAYSGQPFSLKRPE